MIVLLLSFMGIAACWDEFPNVDQDLGMAYKLIVEDGTVELDVLSVLLWGSTEVAVREKGTMLYGLQSRGVFRAKLPDPSIEVVLGMYYMSQSAGAMKSRQELWDAEAFIRKFLVCGYNLGDYAGDRTFQETLYDGVDVVSGLSGSKLDAVRRIVKDRSFTVAVDGYTLYELQLADILMPRPNSKPPTCDFFDPQLLLCTDLGGEVVSEVSEQQVKMTEGHLFEVMVKGENLLLPLLAAEIAVVINMKVEEVLHLARTMYYDNIISNEDCDVDALMVCGEWVVVCSMNRNASHEKWHRVKAKLETAWDSYVSATDASPMGKSVNGKLHAGAVLMEAKQILYVALSVIDDEPPTSWEAEFFQGKPVTRLKLKLWDLIKDIEPTFINTI